MYYHYSAFLNFPPTFACSFIAVFSFLIRFFELVRGNFHGQGCLFIPKRITARKMLGGWSTEWLSSQFLTSISVKPDGGGGGETPGICGAFDFLKEFWAKIPTVGPENWSYLIKCPPTSQWIKKIFNRLPMLDSLTKTKSISSTTHTIPRSKVFHRSINIENE